MRVMEQQKNWNWKECIAILEKDIHLLENRYEENVDMVSIVNEIRSTLQHLRRFVKGTNLELYVEHMESSTNQICEELGISIGAE